MPDSDATLIGITRTGSAPAVVGFCLCGLGIASGVIGFHGGRLAGWLFAIVSIGLAVAAFVFVDTAPKR